MSPPPSPQREHRDTTAGLTRRQRFVLTLTVFVITILLYAGYGTVASTRIGLTLDLPSVPGQDSLQDGLVGHWTFDGVDMDFSSSTREVLDRSGRGNHGNFSHSGIGTSMVSGVIGQAITLTLDNRVYVPGENVSAPDFAFGAGDFSVCFWLNTTETGFFNIVQTAVSASINTRWQIRKSGSGSKMMLILRDGDGVETNYASTISVDFNGVWQHFCVVADRDGDATFYKNYATTDTVDISGQSSLNLQPNRDLRIGPLENRKFMLDDLRIYNRVLSADEVSRLYQLGEGSKVNVAPQTGLTLEDGLWAHWTFDGADIDISADRPILDRSGNDNTMESFVMGTTAPPILQEGRIGQGIYFDGTASGWTYAASRTGGEYNHLNVPHSVAFWVQPHELGRTQVLLDGGRGGACRREPSVSLQENGTIRGIQESGCSSDSQRNTYSTTALKLQQWHHISVVSGGDGVRLYVDGIQEDFFATTTFTTGIQGCYIIGSNQNGNCGPDGANNKFHGRMDDVRIYNRLLSSDEVRRLYDMGEGTKYNTTITPPDLARGLVGHWTFDGPDMHWQTEGEEVRDRSGQGNHGAIEGGLTNRSGTEGIMGQALSFNGTNDYVSVSANASVELTADLTIATWFYSNGWNPSDSEYMLSKRDTFDGMDWQLIRHNTGTNLRFTYGNSGANLLFNSLSIIPAANRWHHVAITRSGNNWSIYLDGQHRGTEESSGAMPTGDTFRMGAYSSTPFGFFNGNLDDVRLYNRALSEAEIRLLYRLGGRE